MDMTHEQAIGHQKVRVYDAKQQVQRAVQALTRADRKGDLVPSKKAELVAEVRRQKELLREAEDILAELEQGA
jgi:hypothetical protein